MEEEAEKMKYRYLFSWNNLLGREKRRLLNFLRGLFDDDQIEIREVLNAAIKILA